MAPGTLFAIVGPSGAGKDSVIDGARSRLHGDERFSFPRRIITRPAGAVGEDYISATDEEFAAMRENGGLALWWHAHGLSYGIPAAIAADLQRGKSIVANLSREAVAEARARFHTIVVEITAPKSILAHRLALRGRESAEEIRERLDRAPSLASDADATVVNDGALNDAVDRFIAILTDRR